MIFQLVIFLTLIMEDNIEQNCCKPKCPKGPKCTLFCYIVYCFWTLVRLLVLGLIIYVIHSYWKNDVVPDSYDEMKLILYTSIDDNGTKLNINDVKSIKDTTFISHTSTIFIIHGFRSHIDDENGVIKLVKDAYLKNGKHNVIGVCKFYY